MKEVMMIRFFPEGEELEPFEKHVHVLEGWEEYRRVAGRAMKEGLRWQLEFIKPIPGSWPPKSSHHIFIRSEELEEEE